jgi:transposase
MRATPKQYTSEFRSDAVELCFRGDRSIRQVAADLGVNHWTLRGWYRDEEMRRSKKKVRPQAGTPPKNETADEKVARLERENDRLRRVNQQLEMDREILKKAAAFFAKESE